MSAVPSVSVGGNAENNRGVAVAQTDADIAAYERAVRSLLEDAAISSSEVDGSSPDQIDVRQLIAGEDLESGGDSGWSGDSPVWVQSGLSADSYNSVYEVDSDLDADSKIVAIFAVTNAAASPLTTEVRFSSQTGGIFERLQIEGLLTDEDDTLLLKDPVVFGGAESGEIEQYADEGGDDNVIYHGIVAEKSSETLESSQRFLSDLANEV